MSDVIIWHNPRCSKSRQTLALLQENGIDPVTRGYLKDAPSKSEIRAALTTLNLPAIKIIRQSQAEFKDLGLSPDTDDEALIQAMADHPILIERPIVFANGKARIGRPPESVLEIL